MLVVCCKLDAMWSELAFAGSFLLALDTDLVRLVDVILDIKHDEGRS